MTSGRKTSATRRGVETVSPAMGHLKLPPVVETSQNTSLKLHEVYMRPMLNKKLVERKRDKGVEMFATHLKHKEVEF
jgi:hypothetical protein